MSHKQAAEAAFSTVEDELRATSVWMYENPELAYKEVESSRRLSAYLADHGFAVTHPAYGLDTAFEATAGSTGPRVIICCEYDALPKVGHACGHNIIATAALGAGVAIAGLTDELGIRVTVLGTPAEEGGGGKVDLINAGAFEDAAAAMMIHPSPDDQLDPSFQANYNVAVEYFGKDSHAAFAPWEGINALDAFVNAYMNVATLRQSLLPTDRVHCMVNHGGDASNIIASYTKSTWGIRSADKERLDLLIPKVKACFEAAALATGCRWERRERGHAYDAMITNRVLGEVLGDNLAALGRKMQRGADLPPGASGSTDMGNVSQVLPSAHPFLGIDSLPFVNHQKEFAAQTVTPAGERAIRDGALAMAWSVVDLAAGDRWPELAS